MGGTIKKNPHCHCYGDGGLQGTTGQGIAIGTAVGGTVLLSYAAFTVVDSLLKNKVLGFDNRLGTAKMAKRSAMLGAAIGFLPALFYGGVTAAAISQ
tara:strand:+ start:2087 stop:2377 length:291 start_codon:yes stop_codon:yes gene_type:complete